eukprot:scaffold267_cov192-Amphora_coffeaeformis.AAC.3
MLTSQMPCTRRILPLAIITLLRWPRSRMMNKAWVYMMNGGHYTGPTTNYCTEDGHSIVLQAPPTNSSIAWSFRCGFGHSRECRCTRHGWSLCLGLNIGCIHMLCPK